MKNKVQQLFARVVMGASLTVFFTVTASAVIVQSTNRSINNGPADFGAGTHTGGGPSGNASITYDWASGGGQLISTVRIRGTLYWDSLISSGCTRLFLRFKDTNDDDLSFQTIDECGPGGNANDTANQTLIDRSFSSSALSHVVITTAIGNGATSSNATSITITQVIQRVYPVTIQNGKADFGKGFHAFGAPQEPGSVTFRRNIAAGTISGIVDGILYYDSFNSLSCARMIIDRRNSAGGFLNTQTFLNCGPGRDANSGANQLVINNNSFTSGSLSDLRLQVADTGLLTGGVINTYGFSGLVGDFEVEPAEATLEVNEPFDYGFIWSVPEPLNWHDIDTLELRVRHGATTIMQVRFEDSGNLISLFNEQKSEYGKAGVIGSNKKLQNQFVTLDLAESTVGPINNAIGFGPNSPTVRLGLNLAFKPSSRDAVYSVEVAATDDDGNADPWAFAGTITVPR
jgi:hypothetical protein